MGKSLFQGSAESNYSQQSSESLDGDPVEREAITTAPPSGLSSSKPRDQTRSATDALERCKTKPVAFAVRTNIDYIPSTDDLCPISKAAIAFPAKEFLHIKDVRLARRELCFGTVELVFSFRNSTTIGGSADW